MIEKLSYIALVLGIIATVGVLFLGILGMLKGSGKLAQNSNALMRWRTICQGLCLLMFAIFLLSKM